MFQYADQRLAAVVEAKSWIGTRFAEGACVKGIGVDCGRFLVGVFSAIGIATPELKTLPHFPHGWFLHKTGEDYLPIVQAFTEVTEEPLPGDIVMFRIGRQFAHGGIIIKWPQIIHAVDPMVQYALEYQIPFVGKDRLFLTPFKS
jgi:cell wall-associated NlpC family hydrolase